MPMRKTIDCCFNDKGKMGLTVAAIRPSLRISGWFAHKLFIVKYIPTSASYNQIGYRSIKQVLNKPIMDISDGPHFHANPDIWTFYFFYR